jgi:hypothetical protein
MHLYPRLTLFLAIGALLTSCAHTNEALKSESLCVVGKRCAVIGNLRIYRGAPASVAEIKTELGCIAAALDDSAYRAYRRWNGRKVRAFGMIYDQPSSGDVISYEIRGRSVAAGICFSGPLMYVESLKLKLR